VLIVFVIFIVCWLSSWLFSYVAITGCKDYYKRRIKLDSTRVVHMGHTLLCFWYQRYSNKKDVKMVLLW